MVTVTRYAYRDVEPADAPFLLEMLRLTVAWRLVPTADGMPPPVLVPPYAFDDLGRPATAASSSRMTASPRARAGTG